MKRKSLLRGLFSIGNRSYRISPRCSSSSINSVVTENVSVTKVSPSGENNCTQDVIAGKDQFANAKPYSEVPKPKGIPFFGTVLHYIWNGGGKYLHEYVQKRHEALGPIYKEKYSTEPFEVLFIGDVEGARDVYKNEGKTPLSFVIGGEELYMKLSGVKRGLLFSQGQEWLQLRKPMNQLLLKRKDYFDNFDLTSQVIHEHVRKWVEGTTESSQGGGRLVTDLGVRVNQIGVCTFGAFAFGQTFKKHQLEIEKDADGFYQLTKDYWEGNMAMQIIQPVWAHKLRLPLWSKFESAISKMLDIGRRWTDLASEDLLDPGFQGPGGFLHIMLQEYNDPQTDSARRIFADFVAALESETTMIQWILYVMGRNPPAQEKVLHELQNTMKESMGELTWSHAEAMPYLNACIKESLRIFPSNCFTVRILPEDSLVKGYRVPAGTIVAVALMSAQRDPVIFPEPDKFWPERWSRTGEDTNVDSMGMEMGKPIGVHGCQPYLPFAWGSTRGCIFRRISVRRMTLFLANIVKSYSFTTREVKPVMRSLMIPDRDMELTIMRRK